jgi:hypothetical protein
MNIGRSHRSCCLENRDDPTTVLNKIGGVQSRGHPKPGVTPEVSFVISHAQDLQSFWDRIRSVHINSENHNGIPQLEMNHSQGERTIDYDQRLIADREDL